MGSRGSATSGWSMTAEGERGRPRWRSRAGVSGWWTGPTRTRRGRGGGRVGGGGVGGAGGGKVGEGGGGVRSRVEPTALWVLDRRSSSLGQAAGVVRPANGGPLATEAEWTWWRADGSFHRSFYVADWP